MKSTCHHATLYRALLLLGLAPGDEVVQWAEALVTRLPNPSTALLDVVMTPAGDLTALRAALQPIAASVESVSVCRTIFARIAADLVSGRRSVADTVTVLNQARTQLSIGLALAVEIDTLVDVYMLAAAGVVGRIDTAALAVRTWLAPLNGDCMGIQCGTPAEAAALIAALSRVIHASPAFAIRDHAFEAWAAPLGPDGVIVHLNPEAFAVAESAFAPVPVFDTRPRSVLETGTCLVFTSPPSGPMGSAEAEHLLAEACG